MCEEAMDELSVLSAIYCREEEFEVVEESAETGLVYRIHTVMETEEKKTPLSLLFQLPPEYPHAPPDVSVSSSELSRKQCQELREGLLSKARILQARPMVHELVLWLQQNFSDLLTTSAPNSLEAQSTADGSAEGLWTALLHLDHMRSKAKYIRLIEKWASELGLTGRLFMGKAILILLQGERKSIKVSQCHCSAENADPPPKQYYSLLCGGQAVGS
ncbi:RWD domain-containing protein 3 isoform X2 [Salminus brasiliensis]|uniref:RWD domain-containing protein 3 isoform X2 n=1 Tax=Salminus brasiliensis TaxID=930266 RepID=UPI003B83680F